MSYASGNFYTEGYESGRKDALLGHQSRYAMNDQGSYGVGYRKAQSEAALANYNAALTEYRKNEFRA